MSSPHADFRDGDGAAASGDDWQPPAWTQVEVEVEGQLPGFPVVEPFPHPAIDPVLPTRWDALGSTTAPLEPAETWTEPSDTWTEPSDTWTEPLGGSDAVEVDAPTTDAPMVTPAPLDEALVAPAAPTLYDDAYRVAFRLTGRREVSHAIASSALRDVVPDGTARVLAVMAHTVAGARAAELDDPDRITYRQHRERLRRELGRHSERDQAILALRHLVGVPAVAVAARLGLHESVVREVGSAWRPADSRGDSSALLRGIDSWISTGLASAEDAAGGAELAHLDDHAD